VIEMASTLAGWTPVFTNTTSPAGTFDFIDTQPSPWTQRFYRAVAAP
jgi:hypothetical protein